MENGNGHDTSAGADTDGTTQAADLLRALANPHRLMLLHLLSEKCYTVMDLCGQLKLRQSLVSQHLARLRLDGVVKAERRGHYVVYSLTDERARALIQTLSRLFPDTRPRGNGHSALNGESQHGRGAGSAARP